MFKRAWLAGLAGVFAISAGVSAAKAESYTLTIVEASCGGSPASCTPDSRLSRRRVQRASRAPGLLPCLVVALISTCRPVERTPLAGFWRPALVHSTNFVSVNGGALTDVLSAGNFTEATLFIFSGTVVGPNSGNIAHDDGIALMLNGILIIPANARDSDDSRNDGIFDRGR